MGAGSFETGRKLGQVNWEEETRLRRREKLYEGEEGRDESSELELRSLRRGGGFIELEEKKGEE